MSDMWLTEFEAELAVLNEQQELKLVAAFKDFAEAYLKPELLMLDLIRETVQKEVDIIRKGGGTTAETMRSEEQPPGAAGVGEVAATQLGGIAPVSEVVEAVQTIVRASGGTPTQQVRAASGGASASGSSRGERGGRWGRGGRRGSTSRRPREMMVTDEWTTESTTAPAPQLPDYATSPVVYFNPKNL